VGQLSKSAMLGIIGGGLITMCGAGLLLFFLRKRRVRLAAERATAAKLAERRAKLASQRPKPPTATHVDAARAEICGRSVTLQHLAALPELNGATAVVSSFDGTTFRCVLDACGRSVAINARFVTPTRAALLDCHVRLVGLSGQQASLVGAEAVATDWDGSCYTLQLMGMSDVASLRLPLRCVEPLAGEWLHRLVTLTGVLEEDPRLNGKLARVAAAAGGAHYTVVLETPLQATESRPAIDQVTLHVSHMRAAGADEKEAGISDNMMGLVSVDVKELTWLDAADLAKEP
jgi:hypothetical protein